MFLAVAGAIGQDWGGACWQGRRRRRYDFELSKVDSCFSKMGRRIYLFLNLLEDVPPGTTMYCTHGTLLRAYRIRLPPPSSKQSVIQSTEPLRPTERLVPAAGFTRWLANLPVLLPWINDSIIKASSYSLSRPDQRRIAPRDCEG